ncbi:MULTISPECIES: hypothetical protein [Brevibacterium]|uniref:Uncharacterized protein n=1 Tax=Brevibacterium ammoniilyticum TaxID=1046555 RepID=A0ABP9U4H5_9MICO
MEWGTIADWVMAVLTGAGFYAAVWQLRSNLKDSQLARAQARKDDEANREAMARAVGIKSTWQPASDGRPPNADGKVPVEVEIVNSGPYPIHNVVLNLESDYPNQPIEIVYGTILPGEQTKDTYQVPRREVVFGELTGGATLKFSDTFGNHWSSSNSWQGLERMTEPPRIC